jgi:hypothetical protein
MLRDFLISLKHILSHYDSWSFAAVFRKFSLENILTKDSRRVFPHSSFLIKVFRLARTSLFSISLLRNWRSWSLIVFLILILRFVVRIQSAEVSIDRILFLCDLLVSEELV